MISVNSCSQPTPMEAKGQLGEAQTGSTKDMKQRWSKHKGDIRNSNWTACGLTRHFGEHHTNNIEEAIRNLKVTLVDCSENEENLKLLEDRWILKMGTLFTGPNSHKDFLSK